MPTTNNLKHFIKSNEVIYSLDVNGMLIQPSVDVVPTEQQFLDYGATDLSHLATPNTRVKAKTTEIGKMGDGSSFSTKVTPLEFNRMIKKIEAI